LGIGESRPSGFEDYQFPALFVLSVMKKWSTMHGMTLFSAKIIAREKRPS
jgi:hypothetical protein